MKLTNEGKYRLTFFEHLKTGLLWIGICAAAGWLFYDTILFSVAGWPGYLLLDRKSTRLNSSNSDRSRMPSSA